MSGIFNYQQNSVSNRRSMFGSYCNTQNDASSMDNTYGMGFRSGLHQASPPGRSLREYEEQMTTLRKENFNLKLRIYFLEEKNSGGISSDNDTIIKQNIDLKVENEELRNEVLEKTQLLCQAAKAMELMEESQKSTNEQYQRTIDELNHKCEMLEIELKGMENVNEQPKFRSLDSDLCDFMDSGNEVNLEEKLKNMENSLAHCRLQNQELLNKIQFHTEDEERIKTLELLLSQLKFENAELQSRFDEKEGSVNTLEFTKCKNQLYELKKVYAEKACELEDVESKLKEKSLSHITACKAIQNLIQKQNKLEQSLDIFRNQSEHHGIEYETSIGKEIVALKDVLLTSLRIVSTNIDELQEHKVETEVENQSIKQICNLFEHQNLMAKVQQKQQEAEKAQKWRKHCSEVCKLLTVRLNELASFLDSLLSNNEFKGLCADRRKAIRIAVDNSLDLSKSIDISSASFNITGIVGRQSIVNDSLLNLSNLSEFLKEMNKEDNDGMTSDVAHQKEIEPINKPCKELVSKKNNCKLNLNLPNTLDDPQSEEISESENSGPNIKNKIKKLKTKKHFVTNIVKGTNSSSSECEELVLKQTPSSNNSSIVREYWSLQEKISILNNEVIAKDNKILEMQCSIADIENKYKEEKLAITQNAEAVLAQIKEERDQMKVQLRVSDMKLLQLQQDLVQLKQKQANEIVSVIDQEEEKRCQLEKRLKDDYNRELVQQQHIFEEQIRNNYIARDIYNTLVQHCDDISEEFNSSKEAIERMRQDINDRESEKQALRRNLNDATLQLSKMGVDRAKGQTNERQLFEKLENLENVLKSSRKEKLELNAKLAEMELANAQLQNKLLSVSPVVKKVKQLSATSDYSQSGGGYTSEDCVNRVATDGLRLNNSSPDLGIESCENIGGHISTKTVNLEKDLKMSPLKENDQPKVTSKSETDVHNCEMVDLENSELKKKLIRTRRALEETLMKLKLSNHRKEQVEKDIRQQILKTQNVLKNVRTNMENELEHKKNTFS